MAGNTPATIPIHIIRGDDFSLPFQICTCDKISPESAPNVLLTEATVIDGVTWTPLNLTGSTVQSQIRKTTSFGEVLSVAFTVVVNDPMLGTYTLSLTNAQTTTLAINDQVSYRYDTQVVTADNKITTYVIGDVSITLDVTR